VQQMLRQWICRFCGVLLFFLPLLLLGQAPASLPKKPAKQPPLVMLVLDASSTMHQKLGDQKKITIVRNILTKFTSLWDPNIKLGLMVYGQSARKGCQDIKVLLPTQKIKPALFKKKIQQIKPGGDSPLSAAVLQAAHELGYYDKKAAVILITDGKDSCQFNPCVLGEELARNAFNLQTYVIGLDVSAKNSARLRCLAQLAGGAYYPVGNGAGLQLALTQILSRLQKMKPRTATVVKLRAASSAQGGGISQGLEWWVSKLVGGVGESYRDFQYSAQAEPVFELTPGKYNVTVTYGELKVSKVIDVRLGLPQEQLVIIGKGTLRLSAQAVGNNKIIISNLRWFINKPVKGFDNQPINIGYSAELSPTFKLLPGEYQVIVEYGDLIKKLKVKVRAAHITKEHIFLNAAYLKAGARPGADAPLLKSHLTWSVKLGKADLLGGHPDVAYRVTANPLFILKPGQYLLEAQWGEAKAEAMVTLKPGQELLKLINLNAGILRLNAQLAEGAKMLDAQVKWTIKQPGKKPGKWRSLAYKVAAQPFFRLKAGRYEVTASLGRVKATRIVTVAPAREIPYTVNLKAGQVHLSAFFGKSKRPLRRVKWLVYQAKVQNGSPFVTTIESEPLLTLPVGDYEVLLQYPGGGVKSKFRIELGRQIHQTLHLSSKSK